MEETCFLLAPSTKHPDYNQRRCPDSRQVLFSTCFMLAPSTKHPDSNQRRCPDSRQVLFSTCFLLAPSTKHPDSSQRRCPDSKVLFSTCFMLANTQTTTRGGDDQTADKSCSPHASCWHQFMCCMEQSITKGVATAIYDTYMSSWTTERLNSYCRSAKYSFYKVC